MSKGRLLSLVLLFLALGFMADFYSKAEEQKRLRHAAIEQEKREKEQQAHEQRMKDLQEQNRQREALISREEERMKALQEQNRQREVLISREEEHMRLRQEMLTQANKIQDKAIRSAKLTQGLNTGAILKMAITEFYQSHGRAPESNEEAGLALPAEYAQGALAAAEVRSGGIIALTYTADTGVNSGEIYLLPNERAFGLGWTCKSPDYQDINKLLPSCVYDRARY
jgi:flagellar biosynthesis GTPase FlhF